MAYASVGTSYSNLGETRLAAENTRKAYELRGRVSERERFYIESHYYQVVTGDLEKARQAYELWAQTYPRDVGPPTNLGVTYIALGQYDKAFAEYREALRLDPTSALNGFDRFHVAKRNRQAKFLLGVGGGRVATENQCRGFEQRFALRCFALKPRRAASFEPHASSLVPASGTNFQCEASTAVTFGEALPVPRTRRALHVRSFSVPLE